MLLRAYTGTRLTTDHSPRTRSIGGWVLHHAAMTGTVEGLLSLMMPGGRTVSAHGAFKDGERIQAVPHDRRAWSLADAYWDSWALTCECINNSGAPGWTLSAATHESIAQWIAATSKMTGVYPHRNGDPKTWTVIGHREVYTIHGGSYATACPGGMDLNWIVRRAQALLEATPGPVALPNDDTPTYAGYPIREIQELLTKAGFPTEVDGIYGPQTEKNVSAFQEAVGLVVDGDVGPATWAALNASDGPVLTIPKEMNVDIFTLPGKKDVRAGGVYAAVGNKAVRLGVVNNDKPVVEIGENGVIYFHTQAAADAISRILEFDGKI